MTAHLSESRPAAMQPNIQDAFLNYARRDRIAVTISLLDGRQIEARIKTRGGARTGLYVPELRTLFVALPSREEPAAIWRLRLGSFDH